MDFKNQFQLLPGTKKRLGIKVPGENRFLYIGSAILGAVLVTSFAMNRYVDSLNLQIQDISNKIIAVNEKRDLKGEELLKITKQQIDTTAERINGHIFWTQGFYKIASLIQDKAQIESISFADNKASLVFLATNYAVIAKQIASFIYDDSIIDVEIGKIELSADGLLGFNMILIIDEAKLIKKTKTAL